MKFQIFIFSILNIHLFLADLLLMREIPDLKNVTFGIDILEKACLNGSEPKACINLERVYKVNRG